MYNSGTFLAPFAPTDVILNFIDSIGRRNGGLNVCQYNKAAVEGNELWVLQHDKTQQRLIFSTALDAEAAFGTLQSAISTLTPNCPFFTTTPGAPPQLIVPITLAQYTTDAGTNSLVPLQWYDVADGGGILGLGPTIRVQAKTDDDFHPEGVDLLSADLVTIDVQTNTVQTRHNTTKELLALNESQIIWSGGSTKNIIADNQSVVTANNSWDINAIGKSILDLDQCVNLLATNACNLTLANVNNCRFHNITGNYITYPFSNITVDRTGSIGKEGKEILFTGANQTATAYMTKIDLEFPELTNDVELVLENAIPQAHAEFRIKIDDTKLLTYKVTIKDTGGTTLAVLTSSLNGLEVTFRFNQGTGLFEGAADIAPRTNLIIPVTSNGQVTFSTVLIPEPTVPENADLYINGQHQVYGVSADYYIVGQDLFWNNNDFALKTSMVLSIAYL